MKLQGARSSGIPFHHSLLSYLFRFPARENSMNRGSQSDEAFIDHATSHVDYKMASCLNNTYLFFKINIVYFAIHDRFKYLGQKISFYDCYCTRLARWQGQNQRPSFICFSRWWRRQKTIHDILKKKHDRFPEKNYKWII